MLAVESMTMSSISAMSSTALTTWLAVWVTAFDAFFAVFLILCHRLACAASGKASVVPATMLAAMQIACAVVFICSSLSSASGFCVFAVLGKHLLHDPAERVAAF